MGIETPKFEESKDKPDLTTPEGRQKEIERQFEKEIKEPKEEPEIKKEKSRQEMEIDLGGKRTAYVGAYKNYREAFGGMKKKDLEAFEKTVESVREYIQPGDSEKLKSEDRGTKENIEAELRKQNFISNLEKSGISFTKAQAIYEAELKKAEYEAAKIELGKKLSEQGVEKAEIFKKLILDERDLLNQAKIESWPPKEKNIFRKGMEWYLSLIHI